MLTKWQICFHHGKVHGEGGCAVHVMYQSTQNIIYIYIYNSVMLLAVRIHRQRTVQT